MPGKTENCLRKGAKLNKEERGLQTRRKSFLGEGISIAEKWQKKLREINSFLGRIMASDVYKSGDGCCWLVCNRDMNSSWLE